MEVEVKLKLKLKLRLASSKAHETLSATLSPFHKQTLFHHNVFFGVSSPHALLLRLRFYGEDSETSKRCLVSLKAPNASSFVDQEEIDPCWGRQVWANPNLIRSVESRIFKRLRDEFDSSYVCLGGFKNVRGLYQWNGFNLVVDQTLYDFGTLYQIQCDTHNPKAKELIEQHLKLSAIPYFYSTLSKFAIFQSGKLPLVANLIGSGAICVSSPKSVDNKPLWQYVTKLGKCEGGGNISFRCNICLGNYKGSYSRVKAHLLKISGLGIKHCSKVTAQHLKDMKRLVDDGTELRMKKAVPLDYRLPSPPPASSGSSSEKKAIVGPEKPLFVFKKRKLTGDSGDEYDASSKDYLDREIARMFFSAGLPFSIADNPFFRNAFTFAAKTNFTDYVPPNCSYLGKELLKRERADIDKWMQPVINSREHKGVTIVCSGWTYPKQSRVNIMAVIGVPIFWKAVNCVTGQNDKFFISNLIKEVIMEIGTSNVVQVITEKAPDCREAGMLIEKAHPHVFWTPCVAHTLDLALRRICYPPTTEGNGFAYRECSWIMEAVNTVRMVKDFIMNHVSMVADDTLDLMVLGLNETWHGYDVVLMQKLTLMKDELQLMVINEKWSSSLDDLDREKARIVKKKLLNDIFWGKIQYILSITEPIYNVMKIVNSGKRCLHLMHEMWGSMIMKVKEAIYYHELKEETEDSMLWSVINQILQDAWESSKNPIYALAHSLNPRYSCERWLNEDLTTRLPPHKDPEISCMRNTCLERYFSNKEDRRWVNVELGKFFENEGTFSETDSYEQRWEMGALTWWTNYGAATPSLQALALKLVSQPCSSWCADPNSLGHDQIDPGRDEELLYVHMNLKSRSLQQQMNSESQTCSPMYGNSFDSDTSA